MLRVLFILEDDMPFQSEQPVSVGYFDINLTEVMYYLYLPVVMIDPPSQIGIRLPPNVECCRPLIEHAIVSASSSFPGGAGKTYKYAYLSARKGWATPDNPLNRPGWHCDGFGTDDINYVWWNGPGTRFTLHDFTGISSDHRLSMLQFDTQATGHPHSIYSPPPGHLYALTPRVVHATPIIGEPGCMRQYIKVSLSNERYNLENNSHNYLFDYDWPLHSRDQVRNDPHKAQADR